MKNTTLTISTTIKNRLSYIKQTLPTWLKLPNLIGIYIVDWSSDDYEDLIKYVKELDDSRIVVEEVSGQQYFYASKSRNWATTKAIETFKSDYLWQVDCDILINSVPDLNGDYYFSSKSAYLQFDSVDSMKNEPGMADTVRPKMGDFGTVLLPTDDVFKYGKYDEKYLENNMFDVEYIRNYWKYENHKCMTYRREIQHIDHDNKLRVACSKYNNLYDTVLANSLL